MHQKDITYYNNNSEENDYLDLNEDIIKMRKMKIIQTPDTEYGFWLASRTVECYTGWQRRVSFDISCIRQPIVANDDVTINPICRWNYTNYSGPLLSMNINGHSLGFRPIFTLKTNIMVEKIKHQEEGTGDIIKPERVYG